MCTLYQQSRTTEISVGLILYLVRRSDRLTSSIFLVAVSQNYQH